MNIYADNKKLSALKQKANKLPLSPGVYIMKDKAGNIIYVGKAKALKNRVTQYFGSGSNHTEKVRKMVSHVEDFEYIICDSEFEALVLECSLIKQNQPKYNILLKDDKGYHYIRITADKWKKIETAMQKDKAGEYIGPYYSAFVVKDTVDSVRKIFKLPDCNRSFDKPSKPCLNFHIGRCDAPCKGKISLESYLETVNSAVDYIKKGDNKALLDELKTAMEKAAENLDFEYAAKLRDRINAITKLSDRQKVVMCSYSSQDVFASAFLGESACVSVLVFRGGRLTDKKHFYIDGIFSKTNLYSDFLRQYYEETGDIPPRLLFDSDFEDMDLIEKWLCDIKGKKVSFVVPQRGEQRELVNMCRNNAADNLAQKTNLKANDTKALNELAAVLGLNEVPRYIESYDISNTAGDENVAGMIVFKDGKPFKAAYKRFKIKSFMGQDDYRSMAEVLDRRFAEYQKGEDPHFSVLPDLILLDGGQGQISAVEPILKKYNLDIKLFGMVKDSKHRTRAIASGGGDILIKSNRPVFTLITNIQDEVHRFAISYHKARRSKKMLGSELLEIEGIGEKKRLALLKRFKTVKAIREASREELLSVDGITQKNADAILEKYSQRQ